MGIGSAPAGASGFLGARGRAAAKQGQIVDTITNKHGLKIMIRDYGGQSRPGQW
jgi:hypothetical protein